MFAYYLSAENSLINYGSFSRRNKLKRVPVDVAGLDSPTLVGTPHPETKLCQQSYRWHSFK